MPFAELREELFLALVNLVYYFLFRKFVFTTKFGSKR